MNLSRLMPAVATLGMCVAAMAADGGVVADVGATVPWTTYEAEQSRTDGTILGPDYKDHTPAREASGRQCVRLSSGRQFIEFTATSDAQGVVIRYSVPDEVGDTSITLSVNDQPPRRVPITSRLTHLYGAYPFNNDPASGSPRNFWDEARVLWGAIRAGDRVRVSIENGDAQECLIDFVELEKVDRPAAQPAGALSIADFGATADDETDDRPALLAAIGAAKAQSKPVWIPQGRYIIKGSVDVADVAVHGAGMWHTKLAGVDDYSPANRVTLNGVGSNVTLSDFAILGKLDYRNDSEPNDGIGGSFGTGSVLRNLWIEHTKAGVWITNSDGLLVENCRFRNNIADGINLCVGMRNTLVRNCTARGTGDDCFAMWPATYVSETFPHGGNRFENCTAQLPFLAQGFSIYGGESNRVSKCLAVDIPYGCGLFASSTFPSVSGFSGTTVYEQSRVVRAGDREGAIGTVANRLDIAGLQFERIEVLDSPNDAVRFMSVHGRALRDAALTNIKIERAGFAGAGYGVVAADDAVGSVRLSQVTVQEAASGPFRNVSPHFEVEWGADTSGLTGKPGR